ncbi:MAG: tetratricopeptide repeat protein [Candidatus Omnitrophica bacterium]|nr:tetratricopeptide repeat protein [Candidatus Omnitrophota bacterium]
MRKITVFLFCVWCAFSLAAENILLKSGKTIEAPVIEKTEERIKVDISGVPITYYLEDIESIDNVKITGDVRDTGGRDSQGKFELYIAQGNEFLHKGNYPSALAKFQIAMELAPERAQAYEGLGWTYFSMRDEREALRYFNKALEIAPDDPRLYDARAQCYFYLKDYSRAENEFLKAKELFQKSERFKENRQIIGLIDYFLTAIKKRIGERTKMKE